LEDIDLVLLLDGSGSVNETNFDLVKGWVKRFAKDMNIEQRHVQIGVVSFKMYLVVTLKEAGKRQYHLQKFNNMPNDLNQKSRFHTLLNIFQQSWLFEN